MHLLPQIAQGVSAALFALYGTGCFVSQRMVAEFVRYRLAHQRVLTGVLQIAGSLGLLAGYFSRPLLLFSAGGLATMMFLAVITRFRIRDPFYAAIPAFSLFVLNLYIVLASI